MKDQASINLKIVDDPISEKASDGCLAIRATSGGLVVSDNAGVAHPLNGGSDMSAVVITEPTTTTCLVNTWYVLQDVLTGTLPVAEDGSMIRFTTTSTSTGSQLTPASGDTISMANELELDVADRTIVLLYQAADHNWVVLH